MHGISVLPWTIRLRSFSNVPSGVSTMHLYGPLSLTATLVSRRTLPCSWACDGRLGWFGLDQRYRGLRVPVHVQWISTVSPMFIGSCDTSTLTDGTAVAVDNGLFIVDRASRLLVELAKEKFISSFVFFFCTQRICHHYVYIHRGDVTICFFNCLV